MDDSLKRERCRFREIAYNNRSLDFRVLFGQTEFDRRSLVQICVLEFVYLAQDKQGIFSLLDLPNPRFFARRVLAH